MTSTIELVAYLRTEFLAAQPDRDESLMGVLGGAVAAGTIDDATAVSILVQLVGAGGESTAGLIANAARLLAIDPGLQRQLRRDPQRVGDFLNEALRLESPFRGHHRHITADTRLGGVELPAGGHLLLLWGAANRDPSVFSDPDVVDLERRSGATALAFGKGVHFCVGSALARLEATAAITVLLNRTNSFTLDEAAPPQWFPSLFVRRHQSLPLALG